METTVKIKAIPMLSKIDGCKSKSGKINNCMRTAKIKPLPTSIKLSIKLRTFPRTHYPLIIL